MNILTSIKKSRVKFFSLLCFVLSLLCNRVYAQDPGGNPDGPPPAVPFDDYLLPILLIVGIGIAFFAIKKMNRTAVKA